MNVIQYKNYQGRFEYDPEADLFHGEVLHIHDVVTFQGRSIDELRKALADSVEDYLEYCAEKGREPEKPYSGRFNLRVDPSLHKKMAARASSTGKSLNAWVTETLSRALDAE